MRVLHVVDRLTERGGAYRHMLGVLEGLGATHDLHLAAGTDDGTARVGCPLTLIEGLDARTAAPVAIDALCKTIAPDVVHLHNLMNPVVLRWAGERANALLTVQDHRYFCPTRGKWTSSGTVCRETMSLAACASCFSDDVYFREVYALTAERLDAVRRLRIVVLSHYVKSELVGVGVAPERVSVIPPFVHGLDVGAEPAGPPCVLYVGCLVEAKGVRDGIDAWRRSGVDLPLVLAGTGPLREALGGPGIEVHGWVPHERLSGLYRRARALLLPSRWQEPFGIAGLEALAFGVPVVAWESGGVREWHPGDHLVAWGDVAGLARALREAVGQRAAPAPGFEPATLMGKLVRLYERVAAS
jgi:glycosyltransferase involved in cell wall biosynthesis